MNSKECETQLNQLIIDWDEDKATRMNQNDIDALKHLMFENECQHNYIKDLKTRIVELEQELEDRAYIELKESYFRLQEENKNLLDRIYRLIKEPTDIGLVLVELDRWLKKEVAYKEVENKLKELLVEHILGDIND